VGDNIFLELGEIFFDVHLGLALGKARKKQSSERRSLASGLG
jgi:hypothetical protein